MAVEAVVGPGDFAEALGLRGGVEEGEGLLRRCGFIVGSADHPDGGRGEVAEVGDDGELGLIGRPPGGDGERGFPVPAENSIFGQTECNDSENCAFGPGVSDAVLTDYRRHVTNPVDLLMSREREILTLIAEGKTNKEIATALNLSVYTVESHRGSVMEKLNLHNTGDIVRFALRNGLTS